MWERGLQGRERPGSVVSSSVGNLKGADDLVTGRSQAWSPVGEGARLQELTDGQ